VLIRAKEAKSHGYDAGRVVKAQRNRIPRLRIRKGHESGEKGDRGKNVLGLIPAEPPDPRAIPTPGKCRKGGQQRDNITAQPFAGGGKVESKGP